MKPKVYVETSVISYLTSRPSRDLHTAAHQQVTHKWWDTRRAGIELFVSEIVVQESRAGDPDAAARRLEVLGGIALLPTTVEAEAFAAEFREQVPLPEKAALDALHIALAVLNGMD